MPLIIKLLLIAFGAAFFILIVIMIRECVKPYKQHSIVLSYKQFKKLYDLKSNSWRLEADYPYFKKADEHNYRINTPVYFKGLGWISYRIFRRRLERIRDKKQQYEIQKQFLEDMNDIIKTEKEKAKRDLEAATKRYQEVVASLGENYE